jgi:LPS-assembly lipoprotein
MLKISRHSLLGFIFLLSLTACGFHLRGHNLNQAEFPFHSLFIKAPSESPFVTDLRNALELNKVALLLDPEKADITLHIVTERTDKQILSISAAGRAQEYELRYLVSLRAYDGKEQEWLPASEILIYRTMTYDDAQALSKEQEELMLYRDMRSDAVQQVMRRLSRAKVAAPIAATDPTVAPVKTTPAP